MDIKVAIVGCGNIANVHFRFISKYIERNNIAICDKDELRLSDFSKQVKVDNCYTELAELLEKFQPQVVHITTPPATHKNISLLCLQKGSHIVLEKPMCLSTEEAKEIIQEAQKHNLFVCVDHMRVFDPMIIETKKILDSGKLGNLINVSAGYSYDFFERVQSDPAAKWIEKLPGGVFFDLLPHHLSVLDALLPNLKVEESMITRNSRGTITDLTCLFSSSQATANIHMSLGIFPLKNYIEFECSQGTIRVDLRNFLITIRKNYGLPNAIERIVENLSLGSQMLLGTFKTVVKFFLGKLDSYAGMDYIIKNFYKSISEKTDSPVSHEKAEKLMALMEEIFSKDLAPSSSLAQKELDPADILVTGGTGFIGRRLINRLLEEGHKVRLFTHQSGEHLNSLYNSPIQIVTGDIYNYSDVERACSGVKTIFHLAAAMKGSWGYHLDTTITGTKNILQAVHKLSTEHLIYVSTLNVYNAKNYPQGKTINEDFPYEDHPEKRGAYSQAKLEAEKEVLRYKKEHDIPVSIFRPGLVYGPGGNNLPKDVTIRVSKILAMTMGWGVRKLPLVYVDNVIDALILAKENREKSLDIFNILDDEYPSQRKYIKKYKKITQDRFFVIYVPLLFVYLGFWALEIMVSLLLKKTIILRYKLKSISYSPKHSTEKLQKSLGWKQNVSFEEGMKRTFEK